MSIFTLWTLSFSIITLVRRVSKCSGSDIVEVDGLTDFLRSPVCSGPKKKNLEMSFFSDSHTVTLSAALECWTDLQLLQSYRLQAIAFRLLILSMY